MSSSCLALTPGEPAGIGPDLSVMLAQQERAYDVVAIADPDLLSARAQQLNLPLELSEYALDNTGQSGISREAGRLSVLPVKLAVSAEAGVLNSENSPYVLETLRCAAKGCLEGNFQAMVTAPLHKGIINDAGIPFTGHTEFLAEYTKAEWPVMMLAAERLRVALATTHLPLSEVSAGITKPVLRRVLDVLLEDLKQKFALPQPRVLVCGLNPHAGEDGHLGHEEIDTIEPVLEEYRAQGEQVIGPLPADTLFTPRYLDNADAVLAMYHDQGLPVLKHVGFGHAVNITLGLPIIRTSVDHGTALDLAGTGKAKMGSLLAALEQAALLVGADLG